MCEGAGKFVRERGTVVEVGERIKPGFPGELLMHIAVAQRQRHLIHQRTH